MSESSPGTPRRHPSRGILLPIALTIALVAAGGWWWMHRSRTSEANGGKPAAGEDSGRTPGRKGGPGGGSGRGATPSVVTAPVHVKDFDVWADSLGTVTPFFNVTIHSRVDGPLLRVLYQEGQTVKAGDLLAEIDPRTFQASLDQTLAATARDKAVLANAKVDLERYRDLAEHDAVPRQTYDTQVSLVNQYEATVRTDEAAAESARLQLSFCRILAPVSGQVGLRQIDPGNMVHAADAAGLVTIAQMDPISVLFSLPQDLLPRVQQQLKARQKIRLVTLDRAGSQQLAQGVLGSVDNQIDTTTGSIKLRGRFDNTSHALYPNQFVNVRILLDTRHNAVVAPSAALLRGSDGSYVYVLKDDRTVTVRPVTPGPVDHGEVVIEQGLADGEQVVIDGTDKLREGLAVSLADGHTGTGRTGAGKARGNSREPH